MTTSTRVNMERKVPVKQGHRLLVIDDEPTILRIITLALRGEGTQILTATDGESALDILEIGAPDLIITDVRLPGIDGIELTRRVKSNPHLSSTPVLLISAYGEPYNHKADAFLPKPFDIDQLSAQVSELLARKSGR